MILNPWDVESHRVYDTNGIMSTLYRKDGGWRIHSIDTEEKE